MDCLYSYVPLRKGEIRVLHLDPASFDDPPVAKFKHGGLEDLEMDYEAISYAWGDPIFPQTISIFGYRILKLAESLHSAL